MAKRSRSRRSDADDNSIASRRLSEQKNKSSEVYARIRRDALKAVALRIALREVEDRRQFHPSGPFRSARSLTGKAHHDLKVKPSRKYSPPTRIMFRAPQSVAVCVRRRQRREVLFAKGKGGGAHRRPRRSWFSSVSC